MFRKVHIPCDLPKVLKRLSVRQRPAMPDDTMQQSPERVTVGYFYLRPLSSGLCRYAFDTFQNASNYLIRTINRSETISNGARPVKLKELEK